MKTDLRSRFVLGAILVTTAVFAQGAGPDLQCPQGFHGHGAHQHGKPCRSGHHHRGHHHWNAPAREAARTNPVPATVASVQAGARTYQQRCAVCHGASRQGDGPLAASLSAVPANLAVVASRRSDGELAWMIAEGRGAMPGWRGVLSEHQIWDVVNFLKKTEARA